VNRAGERLLARPVERLLGFTATELGLGTLLWKATPYALWSYVPGRLRALGNAAAVCFGKRACRIIWWYLAI